MTLREFARLYREMRTAQKQFFDPRTRTQAILERSKRLERNLDRIADEVIDGQMRMFSEETMP